MKASDASWDDDKETPTEVILTVHFKGEPKYDCIFNIVDYIS